MPAGRLATWPVPVPAKATLSGLRTALKVAVTCLAADIASRHAPLPAQEPVQPAKVAVIDGVAVKVTAVE